MQAAALMAGDILHLLLYQSCGPLFQKHQRILLASESETPHAEAVVLEETAYSAKAATAAMVVPTALTQLAMALGVVVEVAQQTEGTDLMAICGLLTGALTDGNL